MNTILVPFIGPVYDPISKTHRENPNEENSRFTRAQSGQLLAWRQCARCGEDFRAADGHRCRST